MTDQEIIEKLGFSELPQEVKEQVLSDVNQVVELRVAGMLSDAMTEEQHEAFQQRSAQSPESTMQWLSREVTDVAGLYEAALADYIDEKQAQHK